MNATINTLATRAWFQINLGIRNRQVGMNAKDSIRKEHRSMSAKRERARSMKSSARSLKGTWKIVWMEQWDQEYVNMVVPGHITFKPEGRGHFQFGCVEGGFNWSEGDSYFDSRWEGCDEMDEVRGEIYAEIEDCELHGTIEFDSGDESDFRAVKKFVSQKAKAP